MLSQEQLKEYQDTGFLPNRYQSESVHQARGDSQSASPAKQFKIFGVHGRGQVPLDCPAQKFDALVPVSNTENGLSHNRLA